MLIAIALLGLSTLIYLVYAASNNEQVELSDTTAHLGKLHPKEMLSIKVTPPVSPKSEILPTIKRVKIRRSGSKRVRANFDEEQIERPMQFNRLRRSPWLDNLSSSCPYFQQSPFLTKFAPSTLLSPLSPPQERHDFFSNEFPTLFFTVYDSGKVYANCDMLVEVTKPHIERRRVVKDEELIRIKRKTHDVILKAPFGCYVSFKVSAPQKLVTRGTLLVIFLVVSTALTQRFSEHDLESTVSKVPTTSPEKRDSFLRAPTSFTESEPDLSPPVTPSSTKTVTRSPPETAQKPSEHGLESTVSKVPPPSPEKRDSFLRAPTSFTGSEPDPSPPGTPSSTKTATRTPSSRSQPQSRASSLESFDSLQQNFEPPTRLSSSFELHLDIPEG